MNISARLLTLALLGLSFGASAQENVYSWKDKSGSIQFSDVPPVGYKAESHTVRTSSAANTLPSATQDQTKSSAQNETLADKALSAKQKADEEKKKQEKIAQNKASEEAKAKNCEQAQLRLKGLQSGMRVKQVDKDGNQSFMGDAERAQNIADTQKAVDENCR